MILFGYDNFFVNEHIKIYQSFENQNRNLQIKMIYTCKKSIFMNFLEITWIVFPAQPSNWIYYHALTALSSQCQ